MQKLDVCSEFSSADIEAEGRDKIKFNKSNVSDHKFTACQTYNIYETGFLWHCIPNTTYQTPKLLVVMKKELSFKIIKD